MSTDTIQQMYQLLARLEFEQHALAAEQAAAARATIKPVPATPLYSYSVGLAKPLDELGQGHTLVSPEPASAEAQPAGGLVEMLGDVWSEGRPLHPRARVAAIRTVATWLDRLALHGSGEYAQAAKVLRQEVGRG
jgi:hypothetical protein